VIARQDALAALAAEELDVLVVGGGITGAGVAFDAAARGYAVGLIERADFAVGTSSRSSKLVHGGLRYLQSFDLGLVREALLERRLMVRLAPHIVHPLPIVVPSFGGGRPDRMVGVGLNLYDVMAVERARLRVRGRRRARRGATRSGPAGAPLLEDQEAPAQPSSENGGAEEEASFGPTRHRLIDGAEVSELLPALAARQPSGGYLFYDCQTDDVRLVLTVLGEAERFGAIIANRLEAIALLERSGRACGVRARDLCGGEEIEIRAANVVNATGVWADQLRPQELRDEAEVPRIRPSRGTHIIFDREHLPLVAGAIVPAGGGRTIFALPWLGATLIGTTDNDYEGPLEHVAPDVTEIDYLLEAVNEFFATSLDARDIAGAYAGVRPLISSADAKRSVDISRRAELYETSSGMLTITGGKLTTWRRMARMTVDRLVEREGREAPCRTHEIPLGRPVAPSALPRLGALESGDYEHLAQRYGRAARELIAIAKDDPELARPILPGYPDLLVEVAYAARFEQALSIGDVLLRRTRLGLLAARKLLDADAGDREAQGEEVRGESRSPRRGRLTLRRRRRGAGRAALQRLAEALGGELSWSRRARESAIDSFYAEAAAEGLLADER
jgi:glycerol-3-phosphate dehydrogenase